ncbi:MAG TPA: ferredoxin-thioredoxin reductase catalytic domain-containing protein [Spirochaetia bacterium]|nr:ferredoxin-thioredoxin reductase catalytic domain-containing protein [Spirochaetia bacterium]
MAEQRSKSTEDTTRFVEMVAGHNGWEVNPDKAFVGHLVDGLTENYNRYGFYLCPCRDSWGERTKDRDITCPCSYIVADQQEYGHCFCGLFLSSEFAKRGEAPQQIPERRPEDLYPH